MKKKTTFSEEFIKKAARLLKGETLEKEQLEKYKQHKSSKKKYKRLGVTVSEKNEQWCIDLAENKDLSRFNKQFRYWLVCIDVYSRFVWVELLKKKTAKNTANKFEKILKKEDYPVKIQCDEGSEFQIIRKELSKKYGFSVFHTYNREIKASHVERVIQTLKTMVRRVLTLTGGFNYHSYLHIIIDRYNKSPHSGLNGFTPYELYRGNKKKNKMKSILLRKMVSPITFTKVVLKQGTIVRVARKRDIFEKSSLRSWGDEKFIIHKVFATDDPITYELKDFKNEKITGIFYFEELQKI